MIMEESVALCGAAKTNEAWVSRTVETVPSRIALVAFIVAVSS